MTADGEDIGPGDLFEFPPEGGDLDPKPIAYRLVQECTDFEHLKVGNAAILFLMRAEPLVKAQKRVLGMMALPKFGGTLGKLGTWLLAKACGDTLPDFIMVLDLTWFMQASPLQRTALVHHELLHAGHAKDKDGEPRFTAEGGPVWEIVGHDVEEFDAVVERYGSYLPDIKQFVEAYSRHG